MLAPMVAKSFFTTMHLLPLLLLLLFSSAIIAQQEEAPTILVAPNDQKVADNGVVSFYCQATGNPPPEVHWRRSGRRIPAHRQRFMIVDKKPSASVLRIDPVRSARRDDGAYECRAENGVGSAAVAAVRLDVYPDGEDVPSGYPRITESPSLKAVEKGKTTVLPCSATGSPAPGIKWLKDFVPINMDDSRFTILPTGYLQITNITETDEGKYECSAENEAGIAFSYPANVYVRVRRIQPHFSIPPESVEVMPGGSVNLSCVAVGSPMPYVKWRLGDNDEITEDPAPIGRNTLVLVNITQTATYTCVASSELGVTEANAEVKVKALPRPPIELLVTRVGPTSAYVSWKSGNIEPIESYTIRYHRRLAPRDVPNELRDVIDMERTLTELVPYSTYELEVVAVNNIGNSLPTVTEFTTAEDAPGSPPLNVRARPVSASTVVVQWEEPELPNGVIKGYKVLYTLTPDQPMSAWLQHSVDHSQLTTIGTLITNQTYSVSVLGFTSIGDGPPSNPIQVKTQLGACNCNTRMTTCCNLSHLIHDPCGIPDIMCNCMGFGPIVPEQPKNLRGEALSANSIQLEWNAPDMSGVDTIESYELYFNDSVRRQNVHVSIVPPSNSYLLEDLTPNTIYHIHVSARSSRGEGAGTPPIVIRTLEAAPSAPPQSVNGETVDSTSIRVSWNAPPEDQRNGVISGYRVLYSEVGSGGAQNEEAVVMASVPATETLYVIRGLHKWTSYSVWVAAYTAAGDGPRSDVIVVQTAEDVPGEPRKVKLEAINSTAVSVQWRPPADREHNGVIRGYQVLYLRLDDRDEGVGEAHVHDVIDVSTLEVVIGGLEPEVQYQFQVAAYTRKGDGARSRPRKIRTKGAILGAPRNLQLTLTQEDPPVVQATWQAPRNALTPILGYRVVYGISGTDIIDERLLDADRYRFTSNFLDRGAEYEFHVSAKNSVDFGDPAIETILTPEGVPAGAPLNVTSSNVTTASAHLHWDAPALRHRNGEIVLYEIMYRFDENFIDEWTTNTSDTQIVVGGLDPAKDYQFQIRAYTSRGSGPWSDQLHVRTLSQYEIPAPINVRIKRLSPTEMEITWDAPAAPPNLAIAGYSVFYNSHVTPNVEQWPAVETGPVTSVIIGKLEPRTVYAAAVRAKSMDARLGLVSRIAVDNRIETEDAIVQNFRDISHNSRSVALAWSPPKRIDVTQYKIEYDGFKHYRDDQGVVASLTDAKGEKLVANEIRNYTISGLFPKTPYVFHISARFSDGTWGPTTTIRSETLVEAPPEMLQPLFNRRNGDSTITMRIYPASEKHGPITHYMIVVVTSDLADKRSPNNFTLTEETGTNRPAWIAARYNAIMLPREFNLGDKSHPGTGEYYNRPLGKNQSYKIFVRSYVSDTKFTSSPYSSSISLLYPEVDVVSVAPSTASMELVWIVAPVCIAVVLILLIVLIIVYVRKRSSKKERPSMCATKVNLPPGELLSYPHDPVELRRLNFQTPGMASHPPIPIAQLAEYIAALRANDGEGFSREYESIEPGQPFTWDASSADINKAKNRYANVVAYDHSRVELEPLPGSDYINANYLDGYCRPKAYIATQGPLTDTFGDFWRMVWEQQANTIVMMTKLEERNRIKCDQYWPNRGTEIYGLVQVTIVEVLELATFTVRTFHISLGNYMDKREVRQFQFTAWPDHGVPEHPLPLLQFIRRVKALTPPDNVPLIVHCSAGVGRTGTYVVIDAMLDRIQHERTLDVYGHVTCLRAQRNYMVQTEDQYVFIYEALLDAVDSGNTEVPADSLYVHVQHLTTLYTSNDPMQSAVTGMEMEFKKLASIKVDPAKFGSASYPVNKHKNRLMNMLPFESTRVNLQPIRGVDGSDYINASFIDGYRCRKAFIATQGPLIETTEDFWRMLWEHNCSIIVMMTRQKEMGVEKCHQYWPEERSARYQYFVVDPVAQYNMPLYILREFKVTDARDGQSRTIRQFQFTDWPEQGVPSSGDGFIEFIGHVQKTKEQFGQDGPITVHCSMGAGRTGVFIALGIILERMRYEGVVDMFQTVRMLRTQRPAMVQTEDQYAFCYRAALEYLGSFDHYAS